MVVLREAAGALDGSDSRRAGPRVFLIHFISPTTWWTKQKKMFISGEKVNENNGPGLPGFESPVNQQSGWPIEGPGPGLESLPTSRLGQAERALA